MAERPPPQPSLRSLNLLQQSRLCSERTQHVYNRRLCSVDLPARTKMLKLKHTYLPAHMKWMLDCAHQMLKSEAYLSVIKALMVILVFSCWSKGYPIVHVDAGEFK